jgi:predicted ABC-type sugar transport system permease subunit
LLLSRTTFGRYVYATGGNAEAARLGGVRVDAIRVATFAISGAAAAFAGVLARFEALGDGWHTLPILQGVEMERPSLIGLEVNLEAGKLAGARIAGKAVKVSEGVIEA